MSIDLQTETYQKLSYEHENTRREHQGILVDSIQNLNEDIKKCLKEDKREYDQAKDEFHQKYNLLKRIFTHSATEHKNSSVEPLKYIYHRRKDLSEKVTHLLNETILETNPLETRTHWNGSIAVVYNPITGRSEWKQYWHGGIHGAFNPITRTVEWKDAFQTGVYGVFNPKLNIVEWKTFFKGGVHGVYNPSTNNVEWQTSFHSGIGGVYNPLTKQVEWKTLFNGGVVGYFDYETETIKWTEKWHHGVALIHWDSSLNTYLTSASCGWYGDD